MSIGLRLFNKGFMIKILYVLNNALDRGGTESVVLNYYYALQHDDTIQIEFALHATQSEIENSSLTRQLILSGGVVHLITPRRIDFKKERYDLKILLLKGNYDIVHSHSDAIGADVLKLAKECGVKVRIAHCHNTNFTINPDSFKNVVKWCYLNICRLRIRYVANYFMACSVSAAIWLFGENKAKITYILNNAINVSKYSFSEEKRKKIRNQFRLDNKYVIGHVGRLSYQKNHEFLIRIFSEIHKTNANSILMLIGEGELRTELEALCKKLGIAKDVIFCGASDNVGDILSAFDVFAFPSRYEGLSLALVEAQANGLHCVVNNTEKVSKAADLTGQITWVPIEDKNGWINALIREYPRNQNANTAIKAHGYDLTEEASKLRKYYIKLCEEN